MKTLIGITTYNGAGRLDHLLHSLSLRTKFDDAVVAVVDDGSPRAHVTRQVVEKWQNAIPIRYHAHPTNRGISAGWNTASRSMDDSNDKADYVVLINDDVIVSKDWLEPLIYVLERSPLVGVVGQSWHAFTEEDIPGLLANDDSDRRVIPREPVSKERRPERRMMFEDTNPARVMCPTGQLFAFRRKDFDAVGGFDERMKSFFEESSFSTEMAARGMIGVQTTWPFCWHMWSKTFSENPELQASIRMEASRDIYRKRWEIPASVPRGDEFSFTNPKYLGAIGDVPIEFLRRSGPARGVLRQDSAFVEAP